MKDDSETDWETPVPFDPKNPGLWIMCEMQRIMKGDCEATFKELTKATGLMLAHLKEHHGCNLDDFMRLTVEAELELRQSEDDSTEPAPWEAHLSTNKD